MPWNPAQLGVLAAALSNDARAAARSAREANFAGVLFDAISPSLDLTELSTTGRREFRSAIASQDVQLIGLRADAGPKGFGSGADVDRILSRLDRIFEAAAGLQSPLVCLDAGPLPAPAVQARPKPRVKPEEAGVIILPSSMTDPTPEAQTPPAPPPDPAFVSQVDGALLELGRRADRYGVTVALRSELASFAALERALLAAGCPWFGVDLDPVAVLRDEWPADEVFSRLGPHLRHVRGRDALAGADRRTKPTLIGQGSTDWRQLLALLDDAGYRGWITIDPTELTDRFSAATRGAEYLRKAQ